MEETIENEYFLLDESESNSSSTSTEKNEIQSNFSYILYFFFFFFAIKNILKYFCKFKIYFTSYISLFKIIFIQLLFFKILLLQELKY